MAKAAEISVLLILLLLPGIQGGLGCYGSCIAAVGVVGSVAGPTVILPALGFTSTGISAGSWAAWWMSHYRGAVPAGGFFDFLQSAGLIGVCSYLCFESNW